MTKRIRISDGTFVLIDAEDFDKVSKWAWSANGNGYAVRNERYAPKKYRKQYLHRFITDAKKGEVVDHINGDTSDNRKCNLRICCLKGNARNNRGKTRKYSKYKGVTKDVRSNRGKWVAQLYTNGKNLYLGSFDSEKEAAKAYNKAAIENFGEFANLNMIEEED